MSRFIKNDEEGHRASFCHFCGALKSGVNQDRALVKHGNARAGERYQVVGHQMNEQVRHRALKVNRARSPERVLTPLRGILGTRLVGKSAMKLWRR